MDKQRFTYLFNKHLHSEISATELEELATLLNSGTYDTDAEWLLDQYWEKSPKKPIEPAVSSEILMQIFASEQIQQTRARHHSFKLWMSAVAAIVILGITTSLLLEVSKPDSDQKSPANVAHIAPTIQSKVYKTTNAHRKVYLPDGSIVILNDHSTLSFGGNFNQKNREVYLTGEGYFDIKHLMSKPFIVNSGKIKTTVLGTAFNIKAYQNSKIEITVTRGKVSVLSGRKIIGILTPNRNIVIPSEVHKPMISSVIATNAIKWQERDIFFDNITFDAAAEQLSKKFNVPISIADDSAKHCRFTATFLQGESLDEILKVICSFNNAQYLRNSTGITITGPGCQP